MKLRPCLAKLYDHLKISLQRRIKHMSNFTLAEKSEDSFKQLTRYAFVGIVSNLVAYVLYLLVTYLGAPPKITMSLLYGVGATIGYIGNRNFIFFHKGSLIGSCARYSIAHFFGYFMNLALLIIFVDKFGYAHQWVQAIAIFVVAGFLFLAFRYFVFTDPPSGAIAVSE
jgi:putative flippase GtrA